MIKKIPNLYSGYYEGYEHIKSKNPLFEDLEQYHFDREKMCEVFDSEFMMWFYEHLYQTSDEFMLTYHEDEYYMIHLRSGTIINWYKHMGRTNTCNKNLSIEDLKEFKFLLLQDFGYMED